MWHLYSQTNVTDIANDQPLLSPYGANQTSYENYSNHQLEDIVLMYQQIVRTLLSSEMKDYEGELTVETWC